MNPKKIAGLPRELKARRAVATELAGLDPEVDYHRMSQILLGSMFSDQFFNHAVFCVSYWRQVAVETIGPVIARYGSGDTLTDVKKRTNDTLLFFGFIYRDGHASERGGRTIDRLAAIHRTFDIKPDDYRYTIGTLCFEATRMTGLLGVPGLTEAEDRALYNFWVNVGRRWGVDLPEDETQEQYREWFFEYERRTYKRTKECVDVALAMEKCFLDDWAPGPLRPLGQQLLRSLSDDLLLDTVDMPRPSPAMKKVVAAGVNAYLKGRRLIPGPLGDNLVAPWSAEYGRVPAPEEVGPRWARGIQVEGRCPVAH